MNNIRPERNHTLSVLYPRLEIFPAVKPVKEDLEEACETTYDYTRSSNESRFGLGRRGEGGASRDLSITIIEAS